MDVGRVRRRPRACSRGAIAAAEAIGDHRLRRRGAASACCSLQPLRRRGAWGVRAAARGRARAIGCSSWSATRSAWRRPGGSSARCTRPRCATATAAAAVERAIECARLGGDTRHERRNTGAYTIAVRVRPDAGARRRSSAVARSTARRGRPPHRGARAVRAARSSRRCAATSPRPGSSTPAAGRSLSEIGGGVLAASTALDSSTVELLAGDPAAAERDLVPRLRAARADGRALPALDDGGRPRPGADRAGPPRRGGRRLRPAEAAVRGRRRRVAGARAQRLRAELHLHAGRLADAARRDRRRDRAPARRGGPEHRRRRRGRQCPCRRGAWRPRRGRPRAGAGGVRSTGRRATWCPSSAPAELRAALGLRPVTA